MCETKDAMDEKKKNTPFLFFYIHLPPLNVFIIYFTLNFVIFSSRGHEAWPWGALDISDSLGFHYLHLRHWTNSHNVLSLLALSYGTCRTLAPEVAL